MAVSKFRRGESTYTCRCCNKLTRNTGGEIRWQLCLDCFTLAEIDNHLSDEGSLDDYADEAREILTRRPELIATEPRIAKALGLTK